MGSRMQYTAGVLQQPLFYLDRTGPRGIDDRGLRTVTQAITRLITRQAFWIGAYPLNRFTRLEFGGSFNSVDRSTQWYRTRIDADGQYLGYDLRVDSITNQSGITYGAPYVAYVSGQHAVRLHRSDRRTSLSIPGRADARIVSMGRVSGRLSALLPDPLQLPDVRARGRRRASPSGRDETVLQKYIGRPEFVRGYDREEYGRSCNVIPGHATNRRRNRQAAAPFSCSAVVSRSRTQSFASHSSGGSISVCFRSRLPPVDGLFFYDVGLAWSGGQKVVWRLCSVNQMLRRHAHRCAATARGFDSTCSVSRCCGGTTRSRSIVPAERRATGAGRWGRASKRVGKRESGTGNWEREVTRNPRDAHLVEKLPKDRFCSRFPVPGSLFPISLFPIPDRTPSLPPCVRSSFWRSCSSRAAALTGSDTTARHDTPSASSSDRSRPNHSAHSAQWRGRSCIPLSAARFRHLDVGDRCGGARRAFSRSTPTPDRSRMSIATAFPGASIFAPEPSASRREQS